MSRKNTSSPSQRVKFFWHPAPDCSSPALFRAGFAFIPRRRFMAEISGSQSVRRQATCWHHANHGSIGGSRQVAALWLCWVVRGSIWWPVRLVVYPAQDTALEPVRAVTRAPNASPVNDPAAWRCALTLLVSSDVWLRTPLLSSTESEQWLPFCGPASAVPALAAYPSLLSPGRTRGMGPASCLPWFYKRGC